MDQMLLTQTDTPKDFSKNLKFVYHTFQLNFMLIVHAELAEFQQYSARHRHSSENNLKERL